MTGGVGHRCSSDPALLWLWYTPAATALIQPLAWELPYAIGAALKEKEKQSSLCTAHIDFQAGQVPHSLY